MTSPSTRDWRVILLAVVGGAGALAVLGLAAALSAYTLMAPWLQPPGSAEVTNEDVTGAFVLVGGMLLIAGVLGATLMAALRALRGEVEPWSESAPMQGWVVLIGIAVWLGASGSAQMLHDRDTAAWAIPILHVLAIAVPIYVLTRLAIAGIGGGSRLRLWGSLTTSMLLGTAVAATVELALLLLCLAAGGIYLFMNPEQVIALQRMAIQLERVADPQEALGVLGPMLTSPSALVLALAAVSMATPVIEEIAKSIPVWALHDRLSRGSQGFWAGALSGAGFALFEGVMVSANTGEGLAFILMLRAGSSLMHILASAMAGWGIGAFRESGKRTRIAVGYAAAMSVHSVWNALVVAIGYGSIRIAYGAMQPDRVGLALSVGGGMMLLALVGLLPIALAGLNLKLRDKPAGSATVSLPGRGNPDLIRDPEGKRGIVTFERRDSAARDGDLALLVGLRHKHFIVTLQAGAKFETHRGVLRHDDLIGRPWGSQVFSHMGAPFFLLQPSLADILLDLPRSTQILYPKDIGFILVTMGLGPGMKFVEAGTGSGSMTIAAAFAVGPQGKVVSYEVREDMQNLAKKNIDRVGLSGRVEFKLRDIGQGIDETDADVFFLDVPNPWDYVHIIWAALKPGGFFCSLVPTFNQIESLLRSMRQSRFAFIEVCEILLRYFKPEPSRIRPTDRMVAHTGFLVFGRRIEPVQDERGLELAQELGTGTGEPLEVPTARTAQTENE